MYSSVTRDTGMLESLRLVLASSYDYRNYRDTREQFPTIFASSPSPTNQPRPHYLEVYIALGHELFEHRPENGPE